MIIVCLENIKSFSGCLKTFYPDFQVFSIKHFSEVPEADIFFVDATFEPEVFGDLSKVINQSLYVVYETVEEAQKIFSSPQPQVLSFISLEMLKSNRFTLPLKEQKTSEIHRSHNTYPLLHNFGWDYLKSILSAFQMNRMEAKDLIFWVGASLETRRIILFRKVKNKFVAWEHSGIEDSYLLEEGVSLKHPVIQYLLEKQEFVSLPGTLDTVQPAPDEVMRFLKFYKMSLAWVIFCEQTSYLILTSSRQTGYPFQVGEIKIIKHLMEFLLESKSPSGTTDKRSLQNAIIPVSGNDFSYLREFANRISNEFKNALVSIKTFTQLMPEKYKDTHFRKDFFNVITHEVKRMEQLMDSISFFASDCVPHLKETEFFSVIEESVRQLKECFPKLEIDVEQTGAAIIVLCDDKLMQKALEALLFNAAECSGGTGQVICRVRQNKSRTDSLFEVEIINSGEISIVSRERMFEPFFSTKPNGLGLGLPLAKTIIEAHGGALKIESEAGKVRVLFTIAVKKVDKVSNSYQGFLSSN